MIIVTNTNTSALILPDPNGSVDMSEEVLDIRDIKGVVDVPVKADKLISAVHRRLASIYLAQSINIPSYVVTKR